ncbi:MAG: ArsR/SmtB family transcription factor [Candidatus Heimdallarchaeota archaeon]
MPEPNGQIENVTKLCKAFGSENRIEMFLKLLKKKKPVNIATDLDISRAGLQKHLESLLETGLLVKKGGGRNTKYLPTKTSRLVLQHLEELGKILEIQREVLKLEETLIALDSVSKTIGENTNKNEFVNSLKTEIKKRAEKLDTSTKMLRNCFKTSKED